MISKNTLLLINTIETIFWWSGKEYSADQPHSSRGVTEMGYGFLDIASTASVKAAQAANGAEELWANFSGDRTFDRFTESEAAFIAERDSFYMATVSESGWPYVQHRGGPAGFLKRLDDKTLAFADFRGNRQYISVGNLAANDRASLILVDYAGRQRLKIYGRVEQIKLADAPELASLLSLPGYRAKPERALLLHLEAFDWNCPQHITPRFSRGEVEGAVEPMRRRLEQLEAENNALREQLNSRG
jgi:predicted pyridoxine 5'-phosphate oxidase superfamily flavin-nucleotide-binding protein